jgi:hypothetical protein
MSVHLNFFSCNTPKTSSLSLAPARKTSSAINATSENFPTYLYPIVTSSFTGGVTYLPTRGESNRVLVTTANNFACILSHLFNFICLSFFIHSLFIFFLHLKTIHCREMGYFCTLRGASRQEASRSSSRTGSSSDYVTRSKNQERHVMSLLSRMQKLKQAQGSGVTSRREDKLTAAIYAL